MAKSYFQLIQEAKSQLESHGKEGHAIQSVFLTRKKWDTTTWLLQMHNPSLPEDEEQLTSDLRQLLADVPPQYLTGQEAFFGRTFVVSDATLIPRPETEELVDQCLKHVQSEACHVVDIGTGTGAIAVTLKAERPLWQVAAVDLSSEALVIAQKNAKRIGSEVTFYHGDTLVPVKNQTWDVIISNPPYISSDEWSIMDASVRQFEPKMALFADDQGLAMYKKIASQAQSCLAENGWLFLEIGYRQGPAVQQIFQAAFTQKEVQVKKDLFGQPRMVIVH